MSRTFPRNRSIESVDPSMPVTSKSHTEGTIGIVSRNGGLKAADYFERRASNTAARLVCVGSVRRSAVSEGE